MTVALFDFGVIMQITNIREPASFGKRTTRPSIIVTHNGTSKQFSISPVWLSICASLALVFMVGYFSATAYLIFRDDLISASYAQKARMKHEYEDRIAALRSKLDHVTSRQLLDQQAIETQVQQLLARQQKIGDRTNSLNSLLKKAEAKGLGSNARTGNIPVPRINPAKSEESTDSLTTGSINPDRGTQIASVFSLRGGLGVQSEATLKTNPHANQFTHKLFGDIAKAITEIDASQKNRVDSIRMAAEQRTEKITSRLKSLGVSLNPPATSNVGGPFVPLERNMPFDIYLDALETSLQRYEYASKKVKSLPLGTPVKTPVVSSHFGTRVDPFNGRVAMHSGIDFKAPTGTPVMASGAGKVIKAGRSGGYGKVVTIRHPSGFTTRYAHLSSILVKEGQRVKLGQKIGKIGSTGRSTGPHLHYEVRSNGSARNPSKYLKVGRQVSDLI